MTANKRGRPATGQGERVYIPLERMNAVKLLKAVPDEQIPALEVILQGLVEQSQRVKAAQILKDVSDDQIQVLQTALQALTRRRKKKNSEPP